MNVKLKKKLSKIPEPYYSNLKITILELGTNPRLPSCKKLKGREAYRIRVADYRVIYEISDVILLVDVVDLGHGKDIY